MAAAPTLITGATGFAGRHLVDQLLAEDPDAALVGWHRHATTRSHPALSWQVVDLTSRDAVTRAIADLRPGRIFHLAGAPHVGDSWRNSLAPLQINALGTHHLLNAVRREHPASRVLVVTSAMIYRASDGPLDEDAALVPSSPYGLSKLAQDQLALAAARDDGLEVVVARPFNHAGPGQDPSFAISGFARQLARIEAAREPPEIRVGNLDTRRDLTDVRDVVAAYRRIMEAGVSGRAYNVCSGVAHRIGDLLDRLVARSQTVVELIADPDRLRPSDMPMLLGSRDRITAELGWSPQRLIDRTLGDTLDWWRAELSADGD